MDRGCYTEVIHETQLSHRCKSIRNSFVCFLGNKNLFDGFIGPSRSLKVLRVFFLSDGIALNFLEPSSCHVLGSKMNHLL